MSSSRSSMATGWQSCLQHEKRSGSRAPTCTFPLLAPSETDYGRHPQQLPACVADFTGRVRELTELTALCRSTSGRGLPAGNKVVVITGSPGVGKSALVIRLARELAAEYPDGQLYSDLRGGVQEPLSPSVVLGHFVRALEQDRLRVLMNLQSWREFTGLCWQIVVCWWYLTTQLMRDNCAHCCLEGHDCLMLVTSRNSLATLEGKHSAHSRVVIGSAGFCSGYGESACVGGCHGLPSMRSCRTSMAFLPCLRAVSM